VRLHQEHELTVALVEVAPLTVEVQRYQGFGNVHRAYNLVRARRVRAFYVIPKDAGLIIPTSAPSCAI
jgi:hypothetical protein